MLLNEKIMHDKVLDSTLNMLKEGYLFIKNRTTKQQTDIIETNLMGEKVICISGKEAVQLFYDEERFQRKGVAPKRVQKTLFGMNTVQGMDGKEHFRRRQLFTSFMTEANQRKLGNQVREEFERAITRWESAEEIILFDEGNEILCKVACSFAGVPLLESEVKERAGDFSAMIDAFAAVGPRHWKGKKARDRAEEWIKNIIENVRIGKFLADADSALHAMSFHKELDGSYMDSHVAAAELINILRPIVAISTYITFTALALYNHPELKSNLAKENKKYEEMFVQEVRRYYPFTPFLGARAKKDFIWNEHKFKEDMLVLLDIYGINHDSRIWKNPDEFDPEHFSEYKDKLCEFIPQGGGDYERGHRCPGEGITIEIMKASLEFLVNKIEYEVPEQDLSYDMGRIPTLPESRFIIRNVKRKF
ncbi:MULTISPECIES: cytochrome P450 [Clostridium]|uniref:Cytochrome P450 n=1 Tax=Clostridium cibarium TaxID=2762247 RepID=A0ABR8PX92_9CLOT|nr:MULTISPECIES: cytochrome P450 [Clostridium]MBD7912768.1 cytochrome P450 [Clostridium cibarium]